MSARKKTARKAGRRKAVTRRKAGARKKVARKTARRRTRAARRPQPPVVSLPKKYDRYFQGAYGGRQLLAEAFRRCCASAPEIPDDSRSIGNRFAELTATLRDAEPALGITDEEIETIRTWPPEQLRTLRAAFIEIFYPPETCRAPKPARFRGRHVPGFKSVSVKHGSTIEVSFTGP